MGSKLGQVAMGIQIGNLEVFNFLDYAVNRKIGGIVNYTQNKGYLINNLNSNIRRTDGILSKRYTISDIEPTGAYGITDKLNGVISTTTDSGVHANGEYIGEYYSVSNNENTKLRFLSNDAFLAAQKQLRRQLVVNDKDFIYPYYIKTSESYSSRINATNSANSVVEWIGYGDQFTVRKTNKKKSDSLGDIGLLSLEYLNDVNSTIDEATDDRIDKYNKYPSVSVNTTTVYRGAISEDANVRKYTKHDSLEDTGAKKLNDIKNHFSNGVGKFLNNAITSLPLKDKISNRTVVSFLGLSGQTILNVERNKLPGTGIRSVGISEFYKTNRLNLRDHRDKIFPRRLVNNSSAIHFTDVYPYGISGNESDDLKIYSVGEKNNYTGTTINAGDESRLLLETDAKINSLLHHIRGVEKDAYGIKYYEKVNKELYPYRGQYTSETGKIYTFDNDKKGNIRRQGISTIQSKYEELRPNDGANKLNKNSTLQRNGFVKITPTVSDKQNMKESVKKYMFSIENLAWRDTTKCLSPEQIGPNNGRIMWFPPYNLKFSENVNVNWNENNFIGRGEGIYTYTNTNRSGTLDFTLLIDHPSIVNKWMGAGKVKNDEDNVELLNFFYGIENLDVKSDITIKDGGETDGNAEDEKPDETPKPSKKTKKFVYVVFFPYLICEKMNGGDYVDFDTMMKNYNNGLDIDLHEINRSENIKNIMDILLTSYECSGIKLSDISREKLKTYLNIDEDAEVFGLSDLLNISSKLGGDEIFGHNKNTCKISKIDVTGNNSADEVLGIENTGAKRYTYIADLFNENAKDFLGMSIDRVIDGSSSIEKPQVPVEADVNNEDNKLFRSAKVTIEIEWNEETKPTNDPSLESSVSVNNLALSESIETPEGNTREISKTGTVITDKFTYDNEYLYFSEAVKHGELQKMVDYVKYFNPAYHSITPEGFNARLTFLHQCTRQGPTNAVSSGEVVRGSSNYTKFAGNLSFGRAPYCILRIGDFFNTKICIDSVSIQYDNNGVQWDLNPEGAGVQPMFANVSISFKFIGGQDISGPIARLQNAVTSNYYANASVYSKHADNETTYYDAVKQTRLEK